MPATDGEEGEAGNAAPGEAFSLLAHDIRLDILLALLDEWRAADTDPQTYSELMTAVGIEDSGKFNYHLEKLRGVYLRKVDEGYVPTGSATALYRAVLGNRPTTDATRTSFAPDAECPDCGAALTGTYETEFLSVECPACEERVAHFTYPFPKNGLAGRTDEEVLDAVHRRARHHVALARAGQCPFCAGTTSVEFLHEHFADETALDVSITCDTCTFVVGVPLLFALSLDHSVATALAELGVAVEETPLWNLPVATPKIESDEPFRVALTVESDNRSATIVVTSDLSVESVAVDDVEHTEYPETDSR